MSSTHPPTSEHQHHLSRRRRRRALIAASIAAVFIVSSSAMLYRFTRVGLPIENGTIRLAGLSAPVHVIRDAAGVPHIYAKNDLDLARAFGYVQAQDRLFQMELRSRLAQGRLAELFGPDLVGSDYFYRLLDPETFAEQSLALYSPEARAHLDAFASGINSYIDHNGHNLPIEFRLLGIQPQHATPANIEAGSLSIAQLLAYNPIEEALYLDLAQRMKPDEIASLMPIGPGLAPELPPPETTAALEAQHQAFRLAPVFARLGSGSHGASNNWVVGGAMTASGKPMLANDPHLPQSLPSIWYEAVLVTPNEYVAGATVAGSPFISIGTNGHVAWGVTSVMADVADLTIERLSPAGQSYEYQGNQSALQAREVTIRVKGAHDVTRIVRSTRHGPLVSDLVRQSNNPLSDVPVRGNLEVALRFAGTTPAPAAEPYLKAARALTGAQLVEAFRTFAVTPLNLVWADDAGNIGWHVIGAIPNRTGYDGKYPVPGWTGQFEWKGMIPYDSLPHSENPGDGIIVTANDRTSDVPYNGSWAAPFRRDRITSLLKNRSRLTPSDFGTIQADRYSLEMVHMRDALLEAGDGGDTDLQWALSDIRDFDGIMAPDSRAAAILAATEVALVGRAFADRLGPDLNSFVVLQDAGGWSAIDELISNSDSKLWPAQGSAATLRASLHDALQTLSERLGANRDSWKWNELATITFKHPMGHGSGVIGSVLARYLNRGPLRSGGERQTVNNGWYNLADPFATVQISSFRMIVDMAHPDRMLVMNHTGESGIPASSHYDDMTLSWHANQYHELDPDFAHAQAVSEATLELVP